MKLVNKNALLALILALISTIHVSSKAGDDVDASGFRCKADVMSRYTAVINGFVRNDKKYFRCTAFVDRVTLKSIVVNRGRCPTRTVSKEYKFGDVFGVDYYKDCENPVEIVIESDIGTTTYTIAE